MASYLKMLKLSPTMEEGQVARWLKKVGDTIAVEETVAEVDTDKATMELTAIVGGTLLKILVPEGGSVPLGDPVGIVGEPGEDIAALIAQAGGEAAPASVEKSASTPAAKDSDKDSNVVPQVAETAPTTAANEATAEVNGTGGRLLVSPVAARMATEGGLDLRRVKGSGPGGRIIKRDVEAALAAPPPAVVETKPALPAPMEEKAAPKVAVAATPTGSHLPPFREESVSAMRAAIARNLVTSIGPVPHFFLTIECEMDKLMELRKQVNAADETNKISVNDFVVKAVAKALMQHPAVNASFQDKAMRYYERADIGVAVAVEDGLITPVVRGANVKSVGAIANEIKEMAGRARQRKLKPEEYTGATFSVSNLGMFGIDEFTAVINPPEAAILAVGGVTAKPVVRDGEIVVRQMMRVTMSCDHRAIDGATGAQFLQTFKKLLENPLLLLV